MPKSAQDFDVRGSGGKIEQYLPEQNAMRINQIIKEKITWTEEGGLAVRLTNKTGAPSVKGSLVETHTNDESFELTGADCTECFGAVYEDGIADGSECLVVVGAIAEVLLKDGTASTTKNWVQTADAAGRADATNGSPAAAPQHFQEVGHCIETKGAGTDVLAKIIMHFL